MTKRKLNLSAKRPAYRGTKKNRRKIRNSAPDDDVHAVALSILRRARRGNVKAAALMFTLLFDDAADEDVLNDFDDDEDDDDD